MCCSEFGSACWVRDCPTVGVVPDERGEAEVADFDVHIFVEKKVLGFDVAMADVVAVDVGHACYQLPEKLAPIVLLQMSLFQDIVKQYSVRNVL